VRYTLLVLACLVLPAQSQDPAADPLYKAYQYLQHKQYLEAIDQFLVAVKAAPRQAAIRKDLAYAYLKVGETESAREVFEQALSLDPADERLALELAFLCHETGREERALELFDRVRRSGDPESAKTAAEAFARVDGTLRQAIERWQAAVRQDPQNRAARLELARNLEKHRQPGPAAAEYLAGWQIPPRREETLLELARTRWDAGDREGAVGAWLVAARSSQARLAERARTRLPDRHPFANEYRRALELDPPNTAIRRELAFLWLALRRPDEALQELRTVVEQDAQDLLAATQLGFLYLERQQLPLARPLLEKVAAGSDRELARRARRALEGRDRSALPHKQLAEKSLARSFLPEALREFHTAYEIDPEDHQVAYQIGVVYNILKNDREAVRYFEKAMSSPDPQLAAQARRAYNNLAPPLRRIETSLWTLPMFSSRFHDVFQYAQLKTEFRLGRLPVRPYLSLRLVGDWRTRTPGPLPQFLSESSLIAGVGVRTKTWRGVMLWGEAGEAASYLRRPPPGTPRLGPDYRGGLAWFGHIGKTLGSESAGPFVEAAGDAVFLSRFQNNVIAYWQMRPGYRLPWRAQVFWNTNVTFDRFRYAYANFVEYGPGFRFRLPGLVDVTISGLRGRYFLERPPYYDLRISLWYAASR
jgi:Tfp pilus assembly protein PilF